jgi:mannitol-specific phosphotransferase system IIBC component
MKYSNQVIIGPVLIMIEKIRRIADNPLEAASLEDKEQLAKEKREEDIKRKQAENGGYKSWREICCMCMRGNQGRSSDGEGMVKGSKEDEEQKMSEAHKQASTNSNFCCTELKP